MDKGRLIQIQPLYDNRQEWMKVAEAKDLGFEVIELSMPPALNESGLFGLYKEWYKNCGRVTSVHGHFIDVNPASGDMKFRKLSRERIEESCELAMELGVKRIVFHTGCAPFLSDGYIEYWAMMTAKFYSDIVARYDINVCIENSPDIDPEALRLVMDYAKDKRVGVCLDIGHVNYTRVPLEQWFKELGERINYIHLSDNMGKFDDHLRLGKGTVDWKNASRLYCALDRPVPVTIEVKTIEDVYSSMEFLKTNGFFLL